MPGHKNERTAEDIRREIISILQEIKDPRVTGKLLTVVRVSVSGDCSYAKVFISNMDGIAGAEEACKALNHAQGFVRSELGRRLHIRKAPELKFIADDSVQQGIDMFKKLNDLK